MEKKEEAFEVCIMSLERFKRRSPKYLFMLDDHGGYDHQDIAALHDVWQAAKSSVVPEGFVLVSKSSISEAVEKIEQLFEEDSLLALGELLPIQQGLKAMIEAQESSHD